MVLFQSFGLVGLRYKGRHKPFSLPIWSTFPNLNANTTELPLSMILYSFLSYPIWRVLPVGQSTWNHGPCNQSTCDCVPHPSRHPILSLTDICDQQHTNSSMDHCDGHRGSSSKRGLAWLLSQHNRLQIAKSQNLQINHHVVHRHQEYNITEYAPSHRLPDIRQCARANRPGSREVAPKTGLRLCLLMPRMTARDDRTMRSLEPRSDGRLRGLGGRVRAGRVRVKTTAMPLIQSPLCFSLCKVEDLRSSQRSLRFPATRHCGQSTTSISRT